MNFIGAVAHVFKGFETEGTSAARLHSEIESKVRMRYSPHIEGMEDYRQDYLLLLMCLERLVRLSQDFPGGTLINFYLSLQPEVLEKRRLPVHCTSVQWNRQVKLERICACTAATSKLLGRAVCSSPNAGSGACLIQQRHRRRSQFEGRRFDQLV